MKHLHKSIPFYFISATLFAIIILSNGCSSSTNTSSNGSNMTMQSQLTTSDVSHAMPVKGATPSSLDFDSIAITNAIVFVSDVKLHSDQDNVNSDMHDQTVKTGPFVLVFDSSGTHVVTTATIAPGTYDRVKFEFHHPDKNADAALLAQFPELQNGGQTYTVWIYGYTVKNGIRSPFTVTSVHSENRTLKFEDNNFSDKDNIVLNANTASTLLFELDPRIVFHLSGLLSGSLFDPRDLADHQKDIDDNLLLAFRVVEF